VRGGKAVSIPSDKAVAVLSGAAGDALGEFWKLLTFGLAHVEDISGAEPNQNGLVLSADVLLEQPVRSINRECVFREELGGQVEAIG
jgi:hypothetical protein